MTTSQLFILMFLWNPIYAYSFIVYCHIMPLPHIQEALQSSGAMVNYCYDVDEELWCQFTLRVSAIVYKYLHGCIAFRST